MCYRSSFIVLALEAGRNVVEEGSVKVTHFQASVGAAIAVAIILGLIWCFGGSSPKFFRFLGSLFAVYLVDVVFIKIMSAHFCSPLGIKLSNVFCGDGVHKHK